MLTVALPKGELLKHSIRILKSVGLDFSAFLAEGNRQLQILDASGKARGLKVRAQDVPVYVEYGQAQLGIVGEDVLREKKPRVGRLVDLGFGYCRMSVAVKATSVYKSPLDLPANCRVASKYVNSARDYFQSLDFPVEIIPLSGSVELGPITGMSEAIVDIVSTGKTIKENGLAEIATLYESTAMLIANPLSYRLNADGINSWIGKLREEVMSEKVGVRS